MRELTTGQRKESEHRSVQRRKRGKGIRDTSNKSTHGPTSARITSFSENDDGNIEHQSKDKTKKKCRRRGGKNEPQDVKERQREIRERQRSTDIICKVNRKMN